MTDTSKAETVGKVDTTELIEQIREDCHEIFHFCEERWHYSAATRFREQMTEVSLSLFRVWAGAAHSFMPERTWFPLMPCRLDADVAVTVLCQVRDRGDWQDRCSLEVLEQTIKLSRRVVDNLASLDSVLRERGIDHSPNREEKENES